MCKICVGQEILIKDPGTGDCIYKPVLWTGTRDDFFISGEDFYEKYTQEEAEEHFGVKFPCFRQDLPDDKLWRKLLSRGVRLVHQEFLPECFDVRDYREWIELKQPFLFPIRVEFDSGLLSLKKVKLPEDLCNAVREGIATIIVESPWETRNLSPWVLEGLVEFQQIYGFPKERVVLCGSQAGSRIENLIESRDYPFVFKKIQYFREICWNVGRVSILKPWVQNQLKGWYTSFESTTGKNGFSKVFLAEIGRATQERLFLFGTLHELFKDKAYFSFRNHYSQNQEDITEQLGDLKSILPRYVEWYGPVADFLESYDYSKQYELDLDSTQDITECFSLESDRQFRESSFIEIIPETNFMNINNTFITEKTYKPMLSAKPFIVFSCPGFLQSLHEDGFKTFGDFWDESYDQEEDAYLRMIKIKDLMQTLSQLSNEEMQRMYRDMKPVLQHNFELLISKQEAEKTLEWYKGLSGQKVEKTLECYEGLSGQKADKKLKRQIV